MISDLREGTRSIVRVRTPSLRRASVKWVEPKTAPENQAFR